MNIFLAGRWSRWLRIQWMEYRDFIVTAICQINRHNVSIDGQSGFNVEFYSSHGRQIQTKWGSGGIDYLFLKSNMCLIHTFPNIEGCPLSKRSRFGIWHCPLSCPRRMKKNRNQLQRNCNTNNIHSHDVFFVEFWSAILRWDNARKKCVTWMWLRSVFLNLFERTPTVNQARPVSGSMSP